MQGLKYHRAAVLNHFDCKAPISIFNIHLFLIAFAVMIKLLIKKYIFMETRSVNILIFSYKNYN